MTLKIGTTQSSNTNNSLPADTVRNSESEKLQSNTAAENEAAIAFLANNRAAIVFDNGKVKTTDAINSFGEKKTVGNFLRNILREQPVVIKDGEREIKLALELKKRSAQMTFADYETANWKAIFKAAGYGNLSDTDIALAVQAMRENGTVTPTKVDLKSLRLTEMKNGIITVNTDKISIEYANRAAQAVLQYQQYKAKEAVLQKQLTESRTNQMLLDPLRLGGNVPFRWAERILNTPKDLLQQIDRGEIMPFSSTAKSIGEKIGEQIIGQPAPKIPTASESIEQLTGIELPAIPEIKLERPFEYQSEKYKREGIIGEDLGATAIDLFLLKRAVFGKSNATSETLKSVGALPETTSAKSLGTSQILEVTANPMIKGKYAVKEMLQKYKGEETGSYWGTKVKYLSETERAKLELFVKNGKIVDHQGRLYDTTSASSVFGNGQGKAIFVMDEQGKIYASKYQSVGKFHHSSFLGGKPVASAGEITIKNGNIVEISNRSGHYTPSQQMNSQILNEFKNRGVDTSSIKISDF